MKIFNRNNEVKEDIINLKNEMSEIQNELIEIRTVKNNLMIKNKSLEEKNNELKEKIEVLKNEISEMKQDITNVKSDIENLTEVEVPVEIETKAEENPVETKKHLYETTRCKPYSKIQLRGEKLWAGKREYSFTINDVIDIKNNLKKYHNENYTMSDIGKVYGISNMACSRLIWNIEEGNFDDIIVEYQSKKEDEIKEGYHIFKVKKSYKVPFKKLMLGDTGELYSSANVKLPYTIQQIISVRKDVYSGKYEEVSDLWVNYESIFSRQLLTKIVWNIEEGNFDDVIAEYQSRNYDYENVDNRLCIDGNDTGLTIGECNVIVECVVNEPNKQECINKLIKNYPNTEPKYIRIIADEYDNLNLDKILKREVKKVVKINNPQKRRELGVYQ